MAVDRKVTAKTLGKAFAELIRDDETVRELWITEDSEGFVISLLTEEIDFDHERHLYGISREVQRKFPDALFEVHVRNLARYTFASIPEMRTRFVSAHATEIALRR